jgi:hypothetical protein
MLDLPEPLGPTIQVIGVEKDKGLFFPNDLKPINSMDLRVI